MSLSFILVENIELDRYIARKLIIKLVGKANIKTFSAAPAALDYVIANGDGAPEQAIILLDLMMPKMSGADFISRFEVLPEEVRNCYRIVIVTSSMNKAELQRLSNHRDVTKMIEKPLTHEKFAALLSEIGTGSKEG